MSESQPGLGTIPHSEALAEAETDSLSVLMSRDPEEFSKIDIARLVEVLRGQRIKWLAAEGAKASAPRAKPSVAKSSIASVRAEDLDL